MAEKSKRLHGVLVPVELQGLEYNQDTLLFKAQCLAIAGQPRLLRESVGL